MSDESLIRDALTIPALLDSDEQGLEIAQRVDEQVSNWLSDPPRIENPVDALGNALFFLGYYGIDVRPLHEKIAQMYLRACRALQFTAPHCREGRRPSGRLRVGFVSRYFIEHTVSKLTSGLISNLPEDEFETILIRFRTKLTRIFDAVRIVKYAPHMEKIEGMSYPKAHRTVDISKDLFEAREQIAELGLDALVYTDIGMEPHTYFLSFARLAPVQCTTWGHPATTGVPAIDYYISAEVLEREGAEADYSERLVRLERLPAFYYRPPAPDDSFAREAHGAAPGARLYGCLQSPFKLLPRFDAVLARLLTEDPNAILLLLGDETEERVAAHRSRLERRLGRSIERVRHIGWQKRPAFLSLLGGTDVLLDTFHFGSGNTAYEAMAVGTPVVTMPGRYMRGRIMAGCYEQLGVKDLVTEDEEAFVRTAIAFASDAELRDHKRAEIMEHGDQLFEDRAAVDAFARFLRKAAQ